MPPDDRYARLDALFDAALDLPTEAQDAFVERALTDHPDLAGELRELLQAHRRTRSLLDAPAVRIAAGPGPADVDTASTGQVGPFRIVRSIGEGGMGQVFLGERADGQFTQRVAVKLIRYPSQGLMRRFLEERRILALLEHRHIARLVDGGITPQGVPYFAMEFVDGDPIDRHCDRLDLPLDARLALVEDVCEAVAYAHQHLVIHRDLKPSNILVTKTGEVKLLDFGIAKLVNERRDVGDDTRAGVRVMTPDVAAPEQVRGRPVSTATDVYALGMLLYLLLTGERAYEVRGRTASEIEHIVCDVVPPAPSTSVRASWRRRVRGDLDLIVLTALQKDEARRYATATALAADLQRFREGRAIAARPDSLGYRVRRFTARHRAAVAVAVAMAAGITGAAARERVLRHRAEVETRKAREVEEFLISTFDVSDPYGATGSDGSAVTARDLLDRGAGRIDTTLSAQLEVQAELRTVMGRVYGNLGVFDRSVPLLRRALEQNTALYGDRDPRVAADLDLLGQALVRQDQFQEGERLLRQALVLRRAHDGEQSAATAESVEHLATALEEQGRLDDAEALHREGLAIREGLHGPSSAEVAASVNDLGLLMYRKSAYADAERMYRRALEIYTRTLGTSHPNALATMQNLAQTLQAMQRVEEAEPLYRQSLELKRATLGDRHPSVTIGLNNLGLFLATRRGQVREGERLVREAIRLDRENLGVRHSYVAEGLRNLGSILAQAGQFAEAEVALRESLAIVREVAAHDDRRIAAMLVVLGQVQFTAGKVDEGIVVMREALARYRAAVGDAHLATRVTRGNLARMLLEADAVPEAEGLARALLAGLDTSSPAERGLHASTLRTLGAALHSQGRPADALPFLQQANTLSPDAYGDTDWRTAYTRLVLGQALAAVGRNAEAAPLLRAARDVFRAHRADQPGLWAQAEAAVADPDRATRQ